MSFLFVSFFYLDGEIPYGTGTWGQVNCTKVRILHTLVPLYSRTKERKI